MDNNTLATVVIIGILVLIAIGMYLGWQGRKKRQSTFGRPRPVPPEPGGEVASAAALYLATTVAGEPLNRVVVGGLGFQANGVITVTETGVIVSLTGGTDFYIPAQDLTGAGPATWTIDRAVENGGLLLVGWNLPVGEGGIAPVAVESYFRVIDPAGHRAMMAAIDSLASSTGATGAAGSETNESDDSGSDL